MEIEAKIDVMDEQSLGIKLARMLIGATAGFIASELARKGFDKFIESRQNSTETTTETE